MESNKKLLKLLEISTMQWKKHLEALLEEEKHYTWWIYIIFGGLIYIYVTEFLNNWQKILIIIPGSLFGVFICFMGFIVVRRESVFLHKAIETYKRTAIVLGFNQPIESPHFFKTINLISLQKMRNFSYELKEKANKSLSDLMHEILIILSNIFRKVKKEIDIGIRDCFQLVFIISAFLFIIFCISSVIALILKIYNIW